MSGKPIAWLHEPTGNVFKDGECQALIKVWQEQFAAEISPEEIAADFVPLFRADVRACTCHPDDSPPVPCQRKYALSDCRSALSGSKE